ncbi:hypothetical protein [Bilophila wadsworthia]|mgnify:CR=1 FL=1|uniref:hypothetical protein n=1 Tax=Bilophila wadsworthia TaxID=35833 RepID=UPI003521D168
MPCGLIIDLLHASPDCTHFSKAKGGKPRSQHIRDLAWVVVRWAEEAKPHLPLLAYLPPRWAGMEARV